MMRKRIGKPAKIRKRRPKPTMGWREWVSLPELGIDRIKAKIDTGARTSAIHAFDIEPFTGQDGGPWVRFKLHPRQHHRLPSFDCTAAIKDSRIVTNSGGAREQRYVIETPLIIGPRSWAIELTLTDRDMMGFRLLIGRTAVRRRFVVDPGRSYLISEARRLVSRPLIG